MRKIINASKIINCIAALSAAFNLFLSFIIFRCIIKEKNAWKFSEKHLHMYKFMSRWIRFKQQGRNLSEYFYRMGYRSIAIYGMGDMGETLVNELLHSNIEVDYGIDIKPGNCTYAFRIYNPDEALPKSDVIVVTALSAYEQIKKTLSNKTNIPIVSIEEVLYGC